MSAPVQLGNRTYRGPKSNPPSPPYQGGKLGNRIYRGCPLRVLLAFGGLLEDLEFAVFDNLYNWVVDSIPVGIKRERPQNSLEIFGIR